MAENFNAHFNKNENDENDEELKKLIEVGLYINQNVSYNFVYQNSLNQKNIIKIKPLNETFFAL